MELHGKYGSATVFTHDVEQEAVSQVINLLNQPMAQGANIRIMPDVHAGAGCVIGYTSKLTDKIVPNLIGVDIGCGVAAWNLGPVHKVGEKFDKLDRVIKTYIPSGKNVNSGNPDFELIESVYKTLNQKISFSNFKESIGEICKRTGQDEKRVWNSFGTLGGGNHFIEVDKDYNNNLWLVIHSGSRNFGLKVAKYHQGVAEESLFSMSKEEYDSKVEEIKKTKKGKGIEVAINALRKEASKKEKASGLEYLEGKEAKDYFEDMNIAQIYAQLNRRLMAWQILSRRYKIDYFSPVESVHNYINFEDGIVRKGAISAHKKERVIIPLNMADGIIIGWGVGNEDWNFSAPHGSGRKMSRSKAKSSIRLEDFQKVMKDSNIWSTSVGKATLDEAPQAYKRSADILELLKESVNIEVHMKPVYNFKASE